MSHKAAGFLSHRDKHLLYDVLREMGIATRHSATE